MANHLFAVCVRNDDYRVSLEKRKFYQVLRDSDAEMHDQIRIIDESGEDYLYPRDYFVILDLPDTVESELLSAAA